ncbi:MAG: CBS domain-containing protein [Planctomycetes bacterium]|nr:CBS domain-containing protein [Planctomycetota bacterium]
MTGVSNTLILIWVIGGFAFILFLLVLLRVKTENKFDIKTSDIIVALIPIILWGLLTGKIKKFEAAGVAMETAFETALQAGIEIQITKLTKLPVEDVRRSAKGPITDIPKLIKKETEALVFQLGPDRYVGSAIERYLDELLKLPFFKYIVINGGDKKLVGIVSARELASKMEASDSGYTPDNIARWLNSSDVKELERLPGFVSKSEAIHHDTKKLDALESMESLNIETLPVVDKEGRFVGIVDRSRLATSLIIEVARGIK